MTDLLLILVKAFWCGWAALGFGILFNSPSRTLFSIWVGGFLAGLIKFIFLDTGISAGIILSTFAAAIAVGMAGIPVAHWLHVPPIIFTIPSVIPLVPGVYAYRTMLGLMKLTGTISDEYSRTLSETVRSGVLALFVIMAIALGVVAPMIVFGKESVKDITLKNIISSIQTALGKKK